MLSKRILTGIYILLIGLFITSESIDIYFTASLNGNLDGCDCKEVPRAGFVKTAVELRKRDRTSSLFIDGGDRLDVIKDPVLADYIYQAYNGLFPDYLLLGDQDFINGTDFLTKNKYRLPFHADNVEIKSANIEKTQGTQIKRNGIDFFLVGLVDPAVKRLIPKSYISKININEAQTLINSLEQELNKKQINILVYHGYEENLKSLLDDNSGLFDIALLTHEQKYIDPVEYSGTLLFSPGPRGNRVGILKLDLNQEEIVKWTWRAYAPDYINSPDDPEVKEMLNHYYDALTL